MGYANARIDTEDEFQKALSTSHPVFMLFVSEHCGACIYSAPLFELIAGKYPSVVSLILDCAHTPRHPEVTATPTLLVFLDGSLRDRFEGLGPPQEQPQFIEGLFKRYAHEEDAGAPASPGAPPPPLPSGASLHAPGYRQPPADGQAGSLPSPPGFDNPRSRQP